VVQGHDHPALLSTELDVLDMHWISGIAADAAISYAAKARYRQSDAACRFTLQKNDTAHFTFDQAQWAVTPGQSVVVYDGDICLGGGIIQ
jgi:tRNA-specific 2-thiouridylase